MAMLVNTNAALRTVKGKMKQLLRLQLQVNVNLLCFVQLLFSLSVVVFKLSSFFKFCLLILCPDPPEINPGLKNQSVTYNSSLRFKCSLSGFPTPEILWTRDGLNLSNNNTFTINRVSYGDAGQYKCSAKNIGGNPESAFHLTVTGKC